ncbi:MAG TPA: OmpA family protein, partial [Bacteroidia bacterium]|nr:OmpA family protein [Bacteroidia bacterium]
KDKNVLQKVKRGKDGTFQFATLPAEENVLFSIEGDDTDDLKEINITVAGVPKKLVRGADRYFRFDVLKADENKMKEIEAKDVPIKLTKEEAQILKKAFSNLEFETGKDVIKAESFASLDELADLMKKKPEWKLKLSGHTDNQGKKEDNMKLSENRAKAVAKHLMGKGIDEKRFKIFFFGPDKPIAPNTTPQGRQKNRRVEMVIID